MAELIIKSDKILKNIKKLNDYLSQNDIKWTLVAKVLSGHKATLEKLLVDPEIKNLHSIGDSRLSNLKVIKKIRPDIVTMYIKPPAIQSAKNVIKYADISVNSSSSTIEALNKEAQRQGKIHKIVIMVELGELREGVIRENIVDFYSRIFNLSNIKIIGLGTNLGCMYGVGPTYDKLIQLCLYEQLLESKFNKRLEIISGGSSITLPLVGKKKIPKALNHLRIGEAAFLGTSPLNNKKFRNLSTDTFEYDANIVEMEEKESSPDGVISKASIGHLNEPENQKNKKTYRAILDFGILDVDVTDIEPKDKNIQFIGTTSDMTVYSLGTNINKSQRLKYKVGNRIAFKPNYMAVARLMNSKFISKRVK
ncbi:MAG: alanine racemase [Candidatus Cloacimonadota bacterium]|nr:alanine racemase [Candidatus Cloacimonadota bacterium]